MRKPLIGGNWKMNLTPAEAAEWCRAFRTSLDGDGDLGSDVVVFPSFPLLSAAVEGLGETPVEVGAQDLSPEDKGAFTGDVSGSQITAAGCTWALCGHSERRHGHGENDAIVTAKQLAAARNGLRPLVCVGETLDERRSDRTLEVLTRQLEATMAAARESGAAFDLAYEPVWAIGTGETATPEMAQEAHAHLRSELAGGLGSDTAEACRILYGGSAKPNNAAELAAGPDVDGFLVGGASLDPASFLAIIRALGSHPTA